MPQLTAFAFELHPVDEANKSHEVPAGSYEQALNVEILGRETRKAILTVF